MPLLFSRDKNSPYYGNKITFSKGDFTMLEMIIFAVVLVIAQCVGGYIMMKFMVKQFMTKEFIKNYSKIGIEVAKEIQEEMEDMF